MINGFIHQTTTTGAKRCSPFGSQSGLPGTHYSSITTVTLATSSLQNTVQDCHTDAPHLQQYRSNLPLWLNQFSSTRSMRSNTSGAAAVQRTRTRLGDRAFSIAGPRVWNNLPASLRQTVSAVQKTTEDFTFLAVRFRVNIRLLTVLSTCILLL